jgi:mRNA interferase MazF
MKCGTMLKPGEVVLIPFPFSDLSAHKRRPALVLTQPDAYGDFLAVAITSQPSHQDAFEITQTDLVIGSLPKRSWVRVRKIYSLNTSIVVASFGEVSSVAFERIHQGLCKSLGCR